MEKFIGLSNGGKIHSTVSDKVDHSLVGPNAVVGRFCEITNFVDHEILRIDVELGVVHENGIINGIQQYRGGCKVGSYAELLAMSESPDLVEWGCTLEVMQEMMDAITVMWKRLEGS